jgi:hypothetical protein
MGTKRIPNKTIYNRCPKDHHPCLLIPAEYCKLDGYQLAIMTQISNNTDDWKIVKYEIRRRVKFPREKFNTAWKSLCDAGYIISRRIQRGHEYTINELPNSTSTTGTPCEGGTLTNTKDNYNIVTSTTGGICDDIKFNELLELYPNTGIYTDGKVYSLKGKPDDCKKAYTEYLKSNVMTHEEILTALTVELEDKRKHGNTKCQPGLYKWIKNKTFEQYKGMIVEPINLGYGNELIC